MSALFKTRWVPNPDGSDSTTAINSTNTAFVHTYIGDDNTGDGTRENPYKTLNKANQKSGVSYIVFRGVVNEYVNASKTIIGDDINQVVVYSNYNPIYSGIRLSYDQIPQSGYITFNGCLQLNNSLTLNLVNYYDNKNNLFYSLNTVAYSQNYNFTIVKYVHSRAIGSFSNDYRNIIITNIFNYTISNSSTTSSLNYWLFPSTCVFQFNGTTIPSPTWTNDPKANVQLIRNAYITAGMSSANALALFQQDSFGNETCQIVWEQRNGGTLPNIFNAYNADGSVADFTLNPDPNNVALWASDIGGYVGCFKPANSLLNATLTTFAAPINVNADGSDDTAAGTLMVVNTDNSINFSTTSAQTWNRMKGNTTLFIPPGKKLNGGASMSQDGSPFGYYVGKYQKLMGTVQYQPTDTLTANTRYKVYNPSGSSVQNAIIYNGIQYLPDYFFVTNGTVLNYSLLNTGSGSVVIQVLTDPLQSIEVIPYDNATTPSVSLPRFSAPLFGNWMMLFYKAGNTYGKAAGTPVLFGDTQVAAMTDKIAYYATWAVTNADWEFEVLSQDTTNYTYSFPILQYLRTELNGHYDFNYDQ